MIHIIAKVPVPGSTKTRLIPRLGPDGAARLSAAMTEDVLDLVGRTGLAARLVVSGPLEHPWLAGRAATAQVGADLGERLEHALSGGGLAVGTDCVLLDPAVLRRAHDDVAAGQVDLVLGLADDGGYTFVAVSGRAVASGVFRGVPWSSPDTGHAQLARAGALGLVTGTTPGGFDVDEPSDLPRLLDALARAPAHVGANTRPVLTSLLASTSAV